MAKKRKLTRADLRREQGTPLPDREAMSLLGGGLGSGAIAPTVLPTTEPPPEASYGTDAGGFAVDQAQAAQTTTSGAENVPNGTATATSQT